MCGGLLSSSSQFPNFRRSFLRHPFHSSTVCVTSASLLYYGMAHPSFRDFLDNAFPTGLSSFLFGMQQPPVSQSGAATSNYGLRVPHLSKRRRDRRQRFSVSERSFERHKVSSSQIRPSTSGNFSQRASWCDDGSRSGPNSCEKIMLLFPLYLLISRP